MVIFAIIMSIALVSFVVRVVRNNAVYAAVDTKASEWIPANAVPKAFCQAIGARGFADTLLPTAWFDGTDTVYNGDQAVKFEVERGFVHANFDGTKQVWWCPSLETADKLSREARTTGERKAASIALNMLTEGRK